MIRQILKRVFEISTTMKTMIFNLNYLHRKSGQPAGNKACEDYGLSTDEEDGHLDVSVSNCMDYLK